MSKIDELIDKIDAATSNHKDEFKNIITCEGMKELNEILEKTETQRIFLIFYGSLIEDEQVSCLYKSWCPDSVRAKPYIDNNIKYLNNDRDTLITVYVGQKKEWKNMNNVFRTDQRFKLKGVPTLLQYKTDKRLVVDECCNANHVKRLFTQ